MADIQKVRITCPTCQNTYDVEVPISQFDEPQLAKGLITVSMKIPCGHACYVFIDKNFKMRGGQCADIEMESKSTRVEPVSNSLYQATELLLKYATEIIKMDVADDDLIKNINAQDKVDLIENALIHGDIKKASKIIGDLVEFTAEIDEKELAARLKKKIQRLNKLVISKPDLDWNAMILMDDAAKNESEFITLRAIHYERLRKIVAELEFEVIEGRLPRAAVDAKKSRLIDLMDKV
jgi:hypothetical protein